MATVWHHEKAAAVLKKLGVGLEGLGADEVRARLKQYGANELPTKKSTSPFVVILRQFRSPLMIILILAAGGSIVVGESGDAIVIGLAILINGIVGFIQEWKAERASEALKSYEIPVAQVIRGGAVEEIDARNIVPGDIVVLSAGSRVPADMRIIQSVGLSVDEALLTGEAFPVSKIVEPLEGSASLGDRVNMAFLGTLVVGGKGQGVVVATGEGTELGDIVKLVTEIPDEVTPLQRQIKRFSWQLGLLFTVVVAAMFAVGVLRGIPVNEMIGIAVALAVASIPEGLLVALTVVLAIGMQRMLKQRALTRRLVAAETLGSVSVVCTDKT
ncbi:HAD-IC family P-type ATPase, partial [Candidatus Uhrbacteria bacterium]|nr:HAD-IC family P-type ATPase [Candidatus Uhrbacteria bacterium]